MTPDSSRFALFEHQVQVSCSVRFSQKLYCYPENRQSIRKFNQQDDSYKCALAEINIPKLGAVILALAMQFRVEDRP